MRKVRVAPKGMGLNDFVAKEEGFFAAEGIEVEWDMKTFRGTQASWKGNDYFQRPQDKPYTEGDKSVIQCACVWGSISNASAGMGRFVPDCYGVSPWAIFVRPDSKVREPGDLKDVPVSVGLRAGSHFNVPFRLEKYLPLEHIRTVNTGGFGARLQALLEGEGGSGSVREGALLRTPGLPRRNRGVAQHADALDLELDAIAGLEKAHLLQAAAVADGARAEELAWMQGLRARRVRDAVLELPAHVARVAAPPLLSVHAHAHLEPIRIADLVGGDEARTH